MVSTYTSNLGLENPTPADPITLNTWGTTENTGRTLVDSAVAGVLTLSVAGSANVVLTTVLGAADQSRNAHFVLTGVLTGNINVLWPNGRTRVFSVINSATGAFTLSCGVDSGAGVPAGAVTAVPAGYVMQLVSDGTNVTQRVTAIDSPAFTGTVTGAVPTGVMFPYAGAAAPAGYALCFGQAINRTTFAALFAVIGTTYGVGDGVTTFNLPDARGRVIAAADNMGGSAANRLTGSASGGVNANALNASGGEQAHILSGAELAAHSHQTFDAGFGFVVQGGGGSSAFVFTGGASAFTTEGNTANAGSSATHNTVQPTLVTNYVIKT